MDRVKSNKCNSKYKLVFVNGKLTIKEKRNGN